MAKRGPKIKYNDAYHIIQRAMMRESRRRIAEAAEKEKSERACAEG